jgi:hypothetical protein
MYITVYRTPTGPDAEDIDKGACANSVAERLGSKGKKEIDRIAMVTVSLADTLKT